MVSDTEQADTDDFRRFRKGQRLNNEFALAQKGNPRFIAVDVETANADLSSICQIAAVSFVGVRAVNVWQSLVDPDDVFEPFNVSLHGIDQAAVACAPRFPEIFTELSSLLTGTIVASHTAFDRVALERACEKYQVQHLDCTWLDTARVCRRAWPRFARRGYGLRSIASWCGIEFHHHDAAEDARAAGSVLARAITETGVDIPEWLTRLVPAAQKNRSLPRRRRTVARRNASRHERNIPAPAVSVGAL